MLERRMRGECQTRNDEPLWKRLEQRIAQRRGELERQEAA